MLEADKVRLTDVVEGIIVSHCCNLLGHNKTIFSLSISYDLMKKIEDLKQDEGYREETQHVEETIEIIKEVYTEVIKRTFRRHAAQRKWNKVTTRRKQRRNITKQATNDKQRA